MKKTKVIEFIGRLGDGGAETLVKDYALLLDKERFDVKIVVFYQMPSTANSKHLRDNGITVIPIYKGEKRNTIIKIWQRLTQKLYVPYRLQRIVKQENPDVIHTHLANLKYIFKISDCLNNIRLFYTCHNLPELLLSGKRKDEGIAARYLIKNYDLQMIALHNDMKKELNAMFDIDNAVVIRNGINFKRFITLDESKSQIRESIGIPKNAFVVGHIGRFTHQKNHDFLIDVFKEVADKKENAFLLLIGSGSLMNEVKAKINRYGLDDRVLILSNRTDVPQLLKAMDVFVFPSRFEGLGNVLIEAQVSGLRCIVSDSVPREAFKTDLAVSRSLSKSPAEWCDVILDDLIKGHANGNLEDYDMNKEIKRLEKLYMGELHE